MPSESNKALAAAKEALEDKLDEFLSKFPIGEALLVFVDVLDSLNDLEEIEHGPRKVLESRGAAADIFKLSKQYKTCKACSLPSEVEHG